MAPVTVWLDSRFIKTTRPARKLDWKTLGPFSIKRVVGTHAYELEFPPDIKIHPVQPVLLLSPVAGDPLPGQIVPPPPPVVVEGEEPEYHVEAVEDSRSYRGTLQYRVRWVGWPSMTWEPWYFVNTTEAVTRFHQRYPAKLGLMPDGAENEELRRRGLNLSGFAGAQPLERGYCQGAAESPTITRHKAPRSPEVTRYDSAHGARDDLTPHKDPREPQPALHATPATAPTAAPIMTATAPTATPTTTTTTTATSAP